MEMKYLFSARKRFSTWRTLWMWLAEAEQQLGLNISGEALEQLRAHQIITDSELSDAAVEEKRKRHDVMAHVHVNATTSNED